ncbi:hypothetical protein Val02_09570 [Virgisporangium aliadipatigenens]|uniref:Uncharacterized protein n=1 Tax=Virgisporangium aliadipatigenens TaxID=741659 RepID=A0A8J3YFJ0_9ACTN|nr:Atu4866 domain-containing protein [Virgisporangium aliadipatigenens]GIJ44071.1 hypothetical protein Val02_09570 [Virgisporangium aliadipatigenens]
MLFVNATVHTLDPALGTLNGTDVLTAGATIAAVGPALPRDHAAVMDCTGSAIVPVFDASVSPLVPGNPATFAVVPADGRAFERVIWWPEQARTILVDGVARASFVPAAPSSPPPRLGVWIDATGHIHQELTADGRYDETRGGRRHAYRGAFRITGDRIVYRDDLGFWAYGRFDGEVLHHAGYTFTRAAR